YLNDAISMFHVSYLDILLSSSSTTPILSLSLHDALPISSCAVLVEDYCIRVFIHVQGSVSAKHSFLLMGYAASLFPATRSYVLIDRKSTRLNSSHQII